MQFTKFKFKCTSCNYPFYLFSAASSAASCNSYKNKDDNIHKREAQKR